MLDAVVDAADAACDGGDVDAGWGCVALPLPSSSSLPPAVRITKRLAAVASVSCLPLSSAAASDGGMSGSEPVWRRRVLPPTTPTARLPG